MPRSQEQNKDIKDKRKQQIVDSSIPVFASQGYDGTSINQLISSARCSHGLFYHYFKDKNELFDAVVGNIYAYPHLGETISRCRSFGGMPGLRTFTEFVDVLLTKNDRTIQYARIFILVPSQKDYKMKTKPLIEGNTGVIALLDKMIIEGQKAGTVKKGDHLAYAKTINLWFEGSVYDRLLLGRAKFKIVEPDILLELFETK